MNEQQSKELETLAVQHKELKADQDRLLEAAKKFEDAYDYTGDADTSNAAYTLHNIIKEIEAKNTTEFLKC